MGLGKALLSRGWVVVGAVGLLGSVMLTASIMFVNARTVALADPRPAASAPRSSSLTLIREIGGPTPTPAPPPATPTAGPTEVPQTVGGLDESAVEDADRAVVDPSTATAALAPRTANAAAAAGPRGPGQTGSDTVRPDPQPAPTSEVDASTNWSAPEPPPTPMPLRKTLGPSGPMGRVATPVARSAGVAPQTQRDNAPMAPVVRGSSVVSAPGPGSQPFNWPPDRTEPARDVPVSLAATPTAGPVEP